MIAMFLEIFPFFALIAMGFLATKWAVFDDAATGIITKFVFYFALPAMLFRFGSGLNIGDVFDGGFIGAYWLASFSLYLVVSLVARLRGIDATTGAVEAQCGVFGNSGFMAIPIMIGLFGEAAVPALMMVLAVDIVFFGNLLIVMITITREGFNPRLFTQIISSLIRNPMVMGMALGLLYAVIGLPRIDAFDRTLDVLGASATPCALFVIGASLATRSAERIPIALWLSFAKLVLHPALAAFLTLVVFKVDPFAAGVMIGVAAMPTAGNIYIVARQYGVAPQRVSTTILVSTTLSVLSLTLILGWIGG